MRQLRISKWFRIGPAVILVFAFPFSILRTPLAVEAQQVGKIPVVGVLNSGTGPRSTTVDTTRQGLRDLGYVEGQTIVFAIRFAGGKPESLTAAYVSTSTGLEAITNVPSGLLRAICGMICLKISALRCVR